MTGTRAAGNASAAPSDALRAEQIAALFDNVAVGVIGAASGAVLLVASLIAVHALPPMRGIAWAAFIVACAAAHLTLRALWRRHIRGPDDWRRWAAWFVAISLAEGIGWGFAAAALIDRGDFPLELLVLVVTLAVAAGAIPAFGSYPPAFLALFLPAALPYGIRALVDGDRIHLGATVMLLIYVLTMGQLGLRAGRNFADLVRLRLETASLAARLAEQKAIAEQASLDKSRFLAAASHDLRQPVHALGLFVGALAGMPMSAEGRRLVARIEESVSAMDNLFSALLDISRLDAGVVEVHRQPFRVAPLIARVCHDHEADAAAKHLRLDARAGDWVVDSDDILLERILRNLVANAVRYTDRGRILLACRRRGDHLRIEVWDTGRGIPLAQRDRVFGEFFQLGNPERDRAQGLGLGLAIVRRLAALLDAPIVLRSVENRGTCVAITVPLGTVALADATDGTIEAAPGQGQGLVLVIDDEGAIQEGMASLLRGWGYDVIAAGSGEEMLARIADCPVAPALIISDFRLRDGESGIDAIERLRSEYNADTPAFLITGDTAPDRLAEAQESGLPILHKPVANARLRAAVAQLAKTPDAS